MSKSKEMNVILKAHKKAVKTAIETAARTGTSLVSHEGTKVKMVKPNVRYVGFEPIELSKKKKSSSTKKTGSKK